MATTIRDVAKRAGVSISTVSRVLNGSSPVREDKRRLVFEAAEALGYSPNPAALSLLGKKTGGIGVLLPFVGGEFFSELLNGLDEAAQELGYFLVISTSHRKPAEFHRAMRVLDKRVDGLVVMAPELDADDAASILAADTPVVFLNTQVDGLQADAYNFDNHAGTYGLTRHLLDQGHTRIAIVQGPLTSHDARERLRGYREAMAEADLPTDGLELAGGYTREAGFAATEALLATGPLPTALLCANDYCAMGVMSALHQAGVDVPGEVSVCGFDGLASTAFTVPPLTTARVPVRDMGDRAIRRLTARLAGEVDEEAFEQVVVPVEIVEQGSTAPVQAPVEA